MRLQIPNLDAMSIAALLAWKAANKSPSLTATQARTYARFKARAMHLRLQGKIEAALAHERECDAIYSRMPKAYRW